MTSTRPEDQRRQGLENNTDGKAVVESERTTTVANNEDRELKDFIARFYENLDDSYDAYYEEYYDTMDYSKTQDNHGSDVDLVTIIVKFLLKKWELSQPYGSKLTKIKVHYAFLSFSEHFYQLRQELL